MYLDPPMLWTRKNRGSAWFTMLDAQSCSQLVYVELLQTSFFSSSAHGFTATASCRLSAGQLDPGMPIVDEQEVITQNQMGTWMFPNGQREPNGMVGHGGSNFATPSTCFLFSHLLSLCKTTSMKHNHRAVQKPLLQLRSSRLRAPSCATLGCGLMFPSHPKTLVEQIQWTHLNMNMIWINGPFCETLRGLVWTYNCWHLPEDLQPPSYVWWGQRIAGALSPGNDRLGVDRLAPICSRGSNCWTRFRSGKGLTLSIIFWGSLWA